MLDYSAEIELERLAEVIDFNIKYSKHTQKWYVALDGWQVKDGNFLKSICEHRETLREAMKAFVNEVKGKTLVKGRGEERESILII